MPAAVALAVMLPGCRHPSREASELQVWGPASLVDVLPQVARAWRRAGGTKATFSFDATSRVARQIVQGAPADVFVAADRRWMDYVQAKGDIRPQTRTEFLHNQLVVIAPTSRPDPGWHSLDDLASTGVHRLVLGGEAVPVGRYADAALRAAGVWKALSGSVVRAEHARAALAWVARGDAGAGIVYRTDAMAEPRVRILFTVPASLHPPIVYTAAVVRGARHPKAAERFIRFLGSKPARNAFDEAGFAP